MVLGGDPYQDLDLGYRLALNDLTLSYYVV